MVHTTLATQAVLYVRVSGDEQQAAPEQEARIRAYGKLRGLDTIDVVYDIGVSAAEPLSSREGGKRLLELIRREQVNTVVVYSLDRLFRSTIELLTTTSAWEKKGVALHVVNIAGQSLDCSSAVGRFLMTLMAAAADLEQTSRSIPTMTQATQTKGRPKGNAQFDGQRFTVRLPPELSQRLMDRARGRADQARGRIDHTHADTQPKGKVSDIIREAVEHYLDGCDREVQEPTPKARTRTRTPAKG